MPVVVSDASVLISLGVIGKLSLLADFYGRVFIPGAVWQEVAGLGPQLAGASEVISARQQGWLQVGQPENRSLVLQLQTSLDGGEAEAIGLAFELQAKLALIDETEGRAAAKALGLAVAGTLGVLV